MRFKLTSFCDSKKIYSPVYIDKSMVYAFSLNVESEEKIKRWFDIVFSRNNLFLGLLRILKILFFIEIML